MVLVDEVHDYRSTARQEHSHIYADIRAQDTRARRNQVFNWQASLRGTTASLRENSISVSLTKSKGVRMERCNWWARTTMHQCGCGHESRLSLSYFQVADSVIMSIRLVAGEFMMSSSGAEYWGVPGQAPGLLLAG